MYICSILKIIAGCKMTYKEKKRSIRMRGGRRNQNPNMYSSPMSPPPPPPPPLLDKYIARMTLYANFIQFVEFKINNNNISCACVCVCVPIYSLFFLYSAPNRLLILHSYLLSKSIKKKHCCILPIV